MKRGARTYFLLCVLLAGLVGLAVGCSRSPEATKARHWQRGVSFAEKEKYREAILEFRRFLVIDPNNAEAYYRIGLAALKLGEGSLAFAALSKSLELNPAQPEARLKLAGIFLARRDFAKAREQIEAVPAKDATSREARLLMTAVYDGEGDRKRAITEMVALVTEQPLDANAHAALAELLRAQGDNQAAEKHVLEAIRLAPTRVEYRLTLASLYRRLGQAARAEEIYKEALKIDDPASAQVKLALAAFYDAQQRRPEARALLGEILGKNPDNLRARRGLITILLKEGNLVEARKELKTLFAKNPSDVEGHYHQGRLELREGHTQEAIQELLQALKLEPWFAEAHYTLGLAYLRDGKVQQARQAFQEALNTAPDSVAATLRLAELDLQAGAYRPAIESLERLLAKHPEPVDAYILLGSAYLKKGDSVKATEVYRKILTQAPKDPRGPYFVGGGLRLQGKTGRGQEAIRGGPGPRSRLRRCAGPAGDDGLHRKAARCGSRAREEANRARSRLAAALCGARTGPCSEEGGRSGGGGLPEGPEARSANVRRVLEARRSLRGGGQTRSSPRQA